MNTVTVSKETAKNGFEIFDDTDYFVETPEGKRWSCSMITICNQYMTIIHKSGHCNISCENLSVYADPQQLQFNSEIFNVSFEIDAVKKIYLPQIGKDAIQIFHEGDSAEKFVAVLKKIKEASQHD